MLKKILFYIVIFISLLTLCSCDWFYKPIETCGGGEVPLSPYIWIRISVINNCSNSLNCSVELNYTGYLLIDNTADMFESEELYLSLKDMDVKVGDKTNINEPIGFIKNSYFDRPIFNTMGYRTLVDIKEGEFIFDVFDRNVKSMNLNLSFGNGEKRVIAGYPKSYYNQPPDAVHYGLFYQFDYDIRGDQESPHYGDPVNGDMTPIPWYTLYSVRITINDPDNITVEVLPETGEELERYEYYYED